MADPERFDVVVIGGAVMGSSVAYHLAADPAFDGSVLILEKDPTYQFCASALSAASIRQQFSTAVNIRISLYGIGFLREIGERLAVEGERPDIALHEGGYLFLATDAGRAVLAGNHRLQQELGADILFLDPAELKQRFPWLALDGLAAGGWGRAGEGWFDGYGLMQAFRRKARSLGVDYRMARAVAVERGDGSVSAVLLDDGARLAAGAVVNCAGAEGAAIARSAGMDIPVRNRKRTIFTFECRERLKNFPLLVDPTGVYCRPEGMGFICGSAPPAERDPDSADFEVDHALFEEMIWPVLAQRVPAFEAIRPGYAWAGHYDMNLFDHNAFVGPAPDLPNFYLCNGFSGHGLQQAPAVGRGIAELIVHGRYTTLDLSTLGFERLLRNEPLVERNVV
jgi:glycine/D-amino acid oxidase-like deaminating enzyme